MIRQFKSDAVFESDLWFIRECQTLIYFAPPMWTWHIRHMYTNIIAKAEMQKSWHMYLKLCLLNLKSNYTNLISYLIKGWYNLLRWNLYILQKDSRYCNINSLGFLGEILCCNEKFFSSKPTWFIGSLLLTLMLFPSPWSKNKTLCSIKWVWTYQRCVMLTESPLIK